jgi:hypothetical protein
MMAAKTDRTTEVSSAPELPGHVAQQFGLPHEDIPAGGDNPDPDSVIDDPKTDAAVDDILHKESDALLDKQPTGLPPVAPTQKRRRGIGAFFKAWWRHKWARWITIVLLLAAIVTVFSVQKLRYAVLNTAGVRSSASVVVLDDTTKLPLRNVTVNVGGKKALTNIEGRAQIKELKLGEYELSIERLAFATHKQKVTVGWGSNPLGEFKLKATGLQYVLAITDYVSGKPIEGVEVVQDGFNALSDASGKVILTVEDAETTTLAVTIRAQGYRTEERTLNALEATGTNVVLVPAHRHVFVSKQSGKYDVFSVDLDGANRKLLLAGSGSETTSLSLVVSPDGQYAAYVSTRDGMRDDDGYLLSSLTIINLKAGTSVVVDHAEQLQLVDWVGNRVVYRITIAGASAANPQRNRLIALNYETNSRAQLATANQFNTILSARGYIYYGASSTDPEATLGLFRIKPDGSGRKQLSQDEVWTGLRATYNSLSIQTPDGWQAYSLIDEKFTKSDAPSALTPYAYINDPAGKQSAWTDIRDGKGTLLVYDITKEAHRTLVSQDGLTGPVRWLSGTLLVYRVSTSGETADYVVSTLGGPARKIVDATPSYGYTQIY